DLDLRVELRRLAETAERRIDRLVAVVALLALNAGVGVEAPAVAERLERAEVEAAREREVVDRHRTEALQREARARRDRIRDLQLQQPVLGLDLVDAAQERLQALAARLIDRARRADAPEEIEEVLRREL